jgi:Holliday junction resolvase
MFFKMNESQIQAKIAKRLREHGWFVTKLIQTSTNGIPDILAIRNGKVIFLEVKSEKGQPSELQKYVIEQINKMGIFAAVVRNIEDVDVFCYKMQ